MKQPLDCIASASKQTATGGELEEAQTKAAEEVTVTLVEALWLKQPKTDKTCVKCTD